MLFSVWSVVLVVVDICCRRNVRPPTSCPVTTHVVGGTLCYFPLIRGLGRMGHVESEKRCQLWPVEFEPVLFLVLDQAGPRPNRTGLGSFLDRCPSVRGQYVLRMRCLAALFVQLLSWSVVLERRVCLSVCLSHAGIESKLITVGSCDFLVFCYQLPYSRFQGRLQVKLLVSRNGVFDE